jgi:hypothetical protein
MAKLRDLYDSARAAEEKVQIIMNEMLTCFSEGTEEGKAKALALRPELDEAKSEADEANQLYISARDADASEANGAASKFVPTGGGEKKAKELTRQEFESLSAADRMSFMLADGKIKD